MENRICGWHNFVQYGFTASHYRIHIHGIGSISTGEDRLAMLIPGAVMFCIGAFVIVVAAAIGMGFGKRATTSEQAPASKNWWEGQSE